MGTDGQRHTLIFPAAILSGETLFLFSVSPPAINGKELLQYFEKLHKEILESEAFLNSHETMRFFSYEDKGTIELIREEERAKKPKPYFITVIPECTAGIFLFEPPHNFPGSIVWMNEILGIVDELSEADELSSFFDYLKRLESYRLSPMVSVLDKFASFKDSKGVLVAGAVQPDLIALDPHWGSEYRHRSLCDFWESFPKINFSGHPRGWHISQESKNLPGGVLHSKSLRMTYVYFLQIRDAIVFINSPSDLMTFEQGNVTDLLMRSLVGALSIYNPVIQSLAFAVAENKIEVGFSPTSLVREKKELDHLIDLIPNGPLWSIDKALLAPSHYAVAVVFDDSKVLATVLDAQDRSVQITLLLDFLKHVDAMIPSENILNVEHQLLSESTKLSRFQLLKMDKIVSFPFLTAETLPDDTDFKMANKLVAETALELKIEHGTYALDEAKILLNKLIPALLSKLEADIRTFDFIRALPLLIGTIESLIHEYEVRKHRIKRSLQHEVDYERDRRSSEHEKSFIRYHHSFRYLIEKFVQLQSAGTEVLHTKELKELVAKADRLLDIYSVSDSLHYQIYPTQVEFSRDFLLEIKYQVDVPGMEEAYGREKAQLDLGLVGKKDDAPTPTVNAKEYMNTVDEAFNKDFGFGLRQLIAVQKVLSVWPTVNTQEVESPYYRATSQQISDSCLPIIIGLDHSRTQSILDFLTLRSNDMLKIIGMLDLAKDIPVWEHWKRQVRYNINPLIRVTDGYLWGPYSVYKSAVIWSNVLDECRLPNDIEAPALTTALQVAHEKMERSLAELVKSISARFTPFVKSDVYPHSFDPEIGNIGDYDVLAYFLDRNVFINIESKIIDPAFCLKDTKRIREKIFGRIASDGTFEKGYLHKVEKRAEYLKSKSLFILERLKWNIPKSSPTVVSLFVTQLGYWWTRFPPVETEVQFVESRLLDDFIRNLLAG